MAICSVRRWLMPAASMASQTARDFLTRGLLAAETAVMPVFHIWVSRSIRTPSHSWSPTNCHRALAPLLPWRPLS